MRNQQNSRKTKLVLVAFVSVLSCQLCVAQTNESAKDWKPATSNQPGQKYPQVNSEGRVRARIVAPLALKVELDISGKRFPMTKSTDGVWMGDSTPQDEGNHYYGLVIDASQTPHPRSPF